MPTAAIPFRERARLPTASDNAAIALRDLAKGTVLEHDGQRIEIRHDILCGHRFATVPIAAGEHITSWGSPFGTAARAITPGEYLCNAEVLFRLSLEEDEGHRNVQLPAAPNFTNEIPPYSFDPDGWTPPPPPSPSVTFAFALPANFAGVPRGGRGTGTRNHLLILGTSASSAPLVRQLESRTRDQAEQWPNVDAIVGLRHTESASADPEEHERTLRTLAGLMTNPNVGAVLAIDSGRDGELNNPDLEAWLQAQNVPRGQLEIRWMRSGDTFDASLQSAAAHIDAMLPELNRCARVPCPLGELRIGLQCGASDAFSGISGNVLAAAIAREVIFQGGAANLTETPELCGAEEYTLAAIARPEIATRFLDMMRRFQQQLGWHGGSIDKNPSGGNLLGGLYNITLKSLGAAVKRDPAIPIRQLTEFAERSFEPGLTFMDGMGGDIASYTGQAAAGCNLILFVTGRGTPTSSSIVPTFKIVNTTERYQLMAEDNDFNAGRFLHGTPMDELTAEVLQQLTDIASGQATAGEQSRQNIDLLWRKKFFLDAPQRPEDQLAARGSGQPFHRRSAAPLEIVFDGVQGTDRVLPARRVGLLIPTVGCAVATANQAVEQLLAGPLVANGRAHDFASLNNTEGCGTTTGAEVLNVLLGYARHPLVEACAFVSLGCEMVSPGLLRSVMRGEAREFPEISRAARAAGYDPAAFGWLTIQDCGGTRGAIASISDWFAERLRETPPRPPARGRSSDFRLGLSSTGEVEAPTIAKLVALTEGLVAAGGTVVLDARSQPLLAELGLAGSEPSLSFAQVPSEPGLHLMQSITANPLEMVTGLGAACDVIVHASDTFAGPAHCLVPTLNLGPESAPGFDADRSTDLPAVLSAVLSNRVRPRQNQMENCGNQIPRGPRAHAI